MKRGTASRVFFGVDKTNEDFGGLLLLSQVILGKKSGMFTDHTGLYVTDNVMLGKGIARVISVIIRGTSPLSLPDAVADSLSYVKAFGGTEQRNLPDGYTELEYIEFDGNTYIDTGITPLNSGATINMKITPSTMANLQFLYGQNPTEGMQQVGCFLYTNGKISWQYSALRLVTDVVAVGTTYDITLGNGSVTINGTTKTRTPDAPFTTNMTVLVGAAWASNYTFVDGRRFVGKVYAFSYKLGGQTLVNLVPAKNSSNVVGMYDLVSGQFFMNQGTGDFTAGPAAVPTPDAPVDIVSNNGVLKARHQSGLPLGYTLLDYIKSNRNIPLGFYTNQNSEIEAKSYKDGAGAQYVYQANSGSTITNNTTAYATDGGGNWRFGNQTISMAFPLNTDIISIQNKNGVWFNNERQGTYTNVNDFTGDVEFRALGVPTPADNPPIRLSYIKHRQNGVLLGHYVPCVASDNSIGLYDLIGGAFYTNAEATITAGDPVSDPVEVYADGTVETIKDSLNNTATAEMLLKVGDYQDVQSIIDGVVTRNVGVKVLDGTESNFEYVTGRFSFLLEDDFALPNTCICTHYVGVSSDTTVAQMTDMQIKCGYTGFPNKVYLKDSRFTSVATMQQYLAEQYAAGTPVIIVYPLATPTTESVAGQTLQVTDGDNVLEITQASMTGLELEAQYQKRT